MKARSKPGIRARWDYSYTVLLLCWCGWIAIYLCRSVLAPILPAVSRELGLTHAQGGMIETAYLLGYLIAKIPAGLVANRIGTKRTLILGMVGYASATALNFLATGFNSLFAFRFLIGLFQGVHLPLANSLLSDRFGDRQGIAIGFHESGANVGNTVAYPVTVAIASSLGWRYAFLFLSLPAFLLAGATTLLLKEERRPEPMGGMENLVDDENGLMHYFWLLAPMGIAHAAYNFCLRLLLTFAPSFLVESRGMGLGTAGLIAMLMPAAGFIAKISSGFVAEKIGRIYAISGGLALSGVFIFVLSRVTGEVPLSVTFVALGLVLYSFSPTIYTTVTSNLPHRLKPIGLGAVTMTGSIFGALSVSIIGYLIDGAGYETTITVVSMVVLLATLLIFMMMRGVTSRRFAIE